MTTTTTSTTHVPHSAVSDDVMALMLDETADARGLPNDAFTSPEFLALEFKHVFTRTWTFAGVASDVSEPGDVKPIEIAGRALILLTDHRGKTRVFHNVCPHRGARLVTDSAHGVRALTCPYHAWSFGLNGELKGRPHFHGPEKHDFGANGASPACLFEARSARWNDLVFVNLDGKAPEFETYMRPLMERYQDLNLDAFQVGHYKAYTFDCNWKLAVENFFDQYHVFNVHPALDAMQTVGDRFGMTPHGHHLFNRSVMAGEGRGLAIDANGPLLPEPPNLAPALRRELRYCALFPNAAMTFFPSNFQFLMFEPVSVDKTTMHMWFFFVADGAWLEEYREARETVVADWDALNAEDIGICRRLQEGRVCDAYDGGRFSPYWDAGTVHFHRQIAEAVRGAGGFER